MVIKINSDKSNISMKLFIFITVFNSFFVSLCNRLPYSGIVITVSSILIILWTLFDIRAKLPAIHVFVFVALALISFINCLIFDVELSAYVMVYLFCYLPMIIAGGIIDFEENKRYLYQVSCVYLIILFIYMIFNYSKVSTVYSDFIDYMGFAYYALPALLIIMYHFFETRDKISMILCIVGAVYLIVCGTRGPILCAGVYLLYCVYNDLKGRDFKRKILFFSVVILGLIVFLNIQSIAQYLYPIFQRNGFSTRFLLYFIRNNNNFLNLEGRDTIQDIVTDNINSHFLTGSGLMSDRTLFGGNEMGYSHNIFLELFNSFGVPFGLLLSVVLMLLILMAYRRASSNTYKNYIMIYFCAALVKLFVSSSFMQESTIFILIGICLFAVQTKTNREVL